MKVSYVVNYSGTIEVDNSEWDQQTRERYENSLDDFVFVAVQESLGAWEGLRIINISEKP